MSGLFGAIQDIMDATHPPQPNPYYGAQQVTPEEYAQHAPKGTPTPTSPIWLDAHGNDITSHLNGLSSDQVSKMTSTPYQQPNFWARLGRNGQEISSLNAQAQNLLGQQLQQRAARRASTLADINTLPSNLTTPFGTPQALATLSGGDLTAGNLQRQSTALSNINKNVPDAESTANLYNAMASGAGALNTATTENELYNEGNPIARAQAQSQATKNQLASSQAEFPNIAPRAKLEGLQISGGLGAQPDLNTALQNRAAIEASTTGQGVKNLPYNNMASAADSIAQAYQSRHPNIAYNPLAAEVFPEQGTIVPGRNLNATIMGQVMNNMGGMSGGGTPQTFSSGNAYIRPQASTGINPLVNPLTELPPVQQTGGGAGGTWDDIPVEGYKGKLPGEDKTITKANAYDDVPMPPVEYTPGVNSVPAPFITDGHEHIVQQKLQDSVAQQQKLLKSIAKQYGTGSPHYKQAYHDYVTLVNSLPK